MPLLGTTARRVVIAILITALIPLGSALFISRAIIGRVSAIAFQPEFGEHLDRALGVYAELARAIKQGMRAEARIVAASERLREAARRDDAKAIGGAMDSLLAEHPSLASLALRSCDGRTIAQKNRPFNPTRERTLRIERELGPVDTPLDAPACEPDAGDDRFYLSLLFTTPRERFDELEGAQAFVQAYHQIERDRREDILDRSYQNAFAALLFITVALAVAAGVMVARPVTKRIARLAAATGPVAAGDLSTRVSIEGRDELAELGRSFNRMLEELEKSRARIEFLRRMSEWQKVARRLAHEIKNPLTPIQLAVEECHRRYAGTDADFRRILDTTLEIVSEEIGSLRRLVGEFSSFARLPRAVLEPGDLSAFLSEQREHFSGERLSPEGSAPASIALDFELPDEPMPAAFDREMLHRVLANVLQNAAQAIEAQRPHGAGKVIVSARAEGDHYEIRIDDDGPGIAEEIRGALFEPYVTTRPQGVGLGLSIVKKIIVDHGGSIEAMTSPLGGARLSIWLPRADTPEARVAKEQGEQGPPSSGRR